MSAVGNALRDFIAKAQEKYGSFYDPYEADWRSRCEVGEPFELRYDIWSRVNLRR